MKITKRQLRTIIKEEIAKTLLEQDMDPFQSEYGMKDFMEEYNSYDGVFERRKPDVSYINTVEDANKRIEDLRVIQQELRRAYTGANIGKFRHSFDPDSHEKFMHHDNSEASVILKQEFVETLLSAIKKRKRALHIDR